MAGATNEERAAGFVVPAVIVTGSADIVFKYAGWGGVLGYSLLVMAAVEWGLPPLLSRANQLSERRAWAVAGIGLAGLLVAVLLVYPIVNVDVPGQGSDGDDMLRQGATALMELRYPFHERTYLGNTVSVMPGSLLLAIPFVALGSIALANVFWTGALLLFVRWQTGSTGASVALTGSALALSPGVWQQFASGTDRFSNGVYVLLGLMVLVAARGRFTRPIAAAAFGVTLSSRVTALVFLPIVFAYMARRRGWRAAMTTAAVTTVVLVGLLAPFALRDLEGLTPITVATQEKLSVSGVAQWLYFAIGLTPIVLAAMFGWSRTMSVEDVLRNCVVVYATAFVLLAAVSSVSKGQVTLDFAGYITGVLPFAILLAADRSRDPAEQTEDPVAWEASERRA